MPVESNSFEEESDWELSYTHMVSCMQYLAQVNIYEGSGTRISTYHLLL